MIEATARFRLASDVRYRLVDGEAVVVVQGRGEVLGLNGTASLAFDRAVRGGSFVDVVDAIFEETDVERAELEADLAELFASLISDHILEVAS